MRSEAQAVLQQVQDELTLVDHDVDARYFAVATLSAGTALAGHSMNFGIRYLTEYDYDAEILDNLNALRVKPAPRAPASASTSSRCG